MTEPPARTRSRAVAWFLGILLALALAWTLRATMSVTLPLAAALFVALAVWPVSVWVERRVPGRLRWLGIVAAMLVVLALLALFLAGIGLAAEQILGRMPGDVGELRHQVDAAVRRSGIADLIGTQQVEQVLARIVRAIGSYASTALTTTASLVAGVVLIFFFVLLMLIEAPVWHAKLASISGADQARWDAAVTAIGRRFRRYFLTRLALGLITGLLYAGWLALFGVDLLIVWGLLAFLLNFVPTVGSLIAGVLPVLYVLATRDPATALAAGGGILVIEQVMGNYVDPRLMGRQLAISPLVILAALLAWTWIWGPAGALLSVPMMVLIVVLFAEIPALRPIALLLSNEGAMAALDARIHPE